MKQCFRKRALGTALALLTVASPIGAKGTYPYKPGEYVTIRRGMAPDRAYSLAAHGEGERGEDNFHLYLMREPGHKKIGPLTEIGDTGDTAPTAFEALWSADSRSVAVSYRASTRVVAMLLYRVGQGRAHPVTGPTLRETLRERLPAARPFFDTVEEQDTSVELTKWLPNNRFVLRENSLWHTKSPALAAALGRYVETDLEDSDTRSTTLLFSAKAVCQVGADDKYRVVEIKPYHAP